MHAFNSGAAGVRTRSLAILALLGPLAACTTAQEIRRPNGVIEYQIACGAASGWNICYNRANELCPDGYETVSEDGGFNRKELRISCPGKKPATE